MTTDRIKICNFVEEVLRSRPFKLNRILPRFLRGHQSITSDPLGLARNPVDASGLGFTFCQFDCDSAPGGI